MKLKKNYFTLLLLTTCVTLNAQNFSWASAMGGTSLDNGLSITVDASGNVYTVGYFQGTADFDPGSGISNLASLGSTDIFISKLNSAGNFVWAKQMGGPGSDVGRSIKVDASGNVYTTGQFSGSVDFNPGAGVFNLTSAGSEDVFVSKLDASGNFVWAKQMGGINNDQGHSIAIDASGNAYVSGAFESTADFDPSAATSNLISAGSFDIFISKLDVSGNFVWAKSFGSTTDDFGLCVSLDASANVYTSGYFKGTADFDPSASTFTMASVNGRDIFISKLDASGNFVWAKQIGGGGDQTANGITNGANGIVCLTGSFAGVADFDTGAASYNLSAVGGQDIFVCVLNPTSGNLLWAISMGGSGDDYGRGITIDAAYNVFTTGEFYGTVDFNPGAGTNTLVALSASSDIFISALDNAGNFNWAKNIGSSVGGSAGNAIVSDATGNIYTTGMFQGTTDFDPNAGVFNLTPLGSQADVFVLKLNSLSTNINEKDKNVIITIYPNPAVSTLTIESEETVETVYVYNLLGAKVMEAKCNSFLVEHLPKGVYTLQIKTKNGVAIARFIKE